MNTVCPGFVPHHVKPNRCRRCFRDINDHKDNSDVSTSFTVPLPRRRRESVAVTETPRRQESQDDSATVSFTITETSSLGRRTRQRSSSTSSWFQDKKEEEKEINLYSGRKFEDSRSSLHRSTDNMGLANEDMKCDSPDSMKYSRYSRDSRFNDSESAEVRIPPARHRGSKTSDRSDSALDLKSVGISENKVKSSKLEDKKDEKLREEAKMKILEDKKERINELKSKSSALREAKESLSRSSSRVSEENRPTLSKTASDARVGEEKGSLERISKSKSDDPNLTGKKYEVGQKTDSKFSDVKNKDSKPRDAKFLESKFLTNKVGESRENALTENENKTKTAKPWELKSAESKTKDVKPWELKPAETKKDVKPWELKPAETKKDVKPWELKPAETKKDVKPWEVKPAETKKDVKPWELKPAETKKDVKPWEVKPAETKKDVKPWEVKPAEIKKDVKPWETKISETKPPELKPKEKSILGRFPSSRKEDTKTKDEKPTVGKNISRSKKVDSDEETDSDSASKKMQRIQIIAAKKLDKAVTSESEEEEVSPDVAFILKVKPTITNQKKDDADSGKANRALQDKIDEFQKEIEKLKKNLVKTEDKCSKLEKDKNELQKKKILSDKDKEALEKTASELLKMKTKINDMQSTQDEVKDENKRLKVELKDVRWELSRREPAEKSKQTIDALKQKLQQTESLCQDLMEENEEIKKEVRDLEQELEELHDNFREDQASEFRGLKKELETAAKNCRVLQFKLRKAERRCEQLELERHSLEDRVREFHMSSKIDVDKARMKELENELRMARNMTVTMNTEIDALKETVKRAETENERLRQHGGSRTSTPTPQASLPSALKESLMGKDYESLAHELSDTMERENDLREQLRFSEDEAKAMRRKLSNLEQENETLMLQMKKLTTVMRARGDKNKHNQEEEEMSAENLKIHLDLMEQEMSVMRRKLEDTEHENESLQSEVKYLQDKIVNQPVARIDLPEPPKDAASPGVYWEYKVRLLEYEVRDSRRKLIEKERDIDRLNAEVEIYRKKASKTMVRSRSLDSDMQVDLKRQLQLVEQEASILRQKVAGMETENEKLVTENKRMTLRLSKKPPMGPADLLQLENMELKQKMEEQERKMTAMKEELEKEVSNNPVAVLQDYKPRKESLTTDNENDLISSLKKRIKTKDEETTTLQSKVMQLEIDNNRLSREYKKLKDTLNLKKKPPKAVRDSATRIELREVVNELQDEISELQVSLRSREVVQEDLEQELERMRKEMNSSSKELRQKEEKLREEANKLKLESETLRQEAAAERQRASTTEEQLQQLVKQKGSDLVQVRRLKDLQAEKEDLERRAKAAEDSLEKKTARLRDTQEKLNVTTALKDEMARSNRMLEAQKLDLEKESEEHRELLTKAEERANELRSQIDKTDRDLTSLRKECNQLRNELEDERTRMKHADNRQSEVTVGWLKERDDLRRSTTELRNKIDTLQQQLTQNEKIWIEKETRLREDHKKKKDAAVREAREKAEVAVELVREEEKIAKTKLNEMSEKLEKAETSLREAIEKHRHSASQHRREREDWQTQEHEFEGQLRAETKRRERLEKEIEQMQKIKDEELLQSRDRLVAIEREQRRNQTRISELEEQEQKAKMLEKELERSKQEYDDLTSKYDQLEEEFVRVKSRLVLEKEQVEGNMATLRRDFNQVTSELAALRETYNSRQDSWIKEKLDLQEKLKEMETKLDRVAGWEQEKIRLKDTIDEKDSLIESYRKEEKHLKEEREKLRRRADDLTKQMDIQKADRQVRPLTTTGRAEGIREVHDMRIRMEHSEKSHQADLSAMQADYEGRMSLMTSEISSMQSQIAKLATERDYYKAQVASVERTAEEIRTGSLKRERARHREEADMARRKVKELRAQTEEMKEQMEDSELEKKNLKLQIETDKNSWEIQISELKSKINQLEEQKLLESTRGQTRNFAKTRLELAWEKERTDLQHLLTDSQQLVSDLKTRLETSEAERQKEKQAARRHLTNMRSSTDTDYQENRRKMSELHSSLLEVRESHAKLRGMYDRMKREREILLKEREEWRQKLHVAQELHGKINEIAKDIQNAAATANPEGEEGAKEEVKLPAELQEMITKVKDRFAELQKAAAALKEDERFKRTTSFRRAVSAQEVNRPQLTDPSQRWMNPQRVTNYPLAPPSMLIRPPPRQKSLQRKSLSLDQSLGAGAADLLKIWESGGESAATTPSGSLLSLRLGRYGSSYGYESDSSLPDSEYRYGSLPRGRMLMTPALTESEPPSSREGSVAGSVESVPAAVQPKRTLKDKLKLLRRTKSIDVTNLSDGSKSQGGLGTLSPKEKEEKEKSLRSKISKVLRKPLGRSSSVDTRKPALPPKGVVPDVVPKRPTAEKPAAKSESRPKSAQGRTTPEDKVKSRSSTSESTAAAPPSTQGSFNETTV